MNIIMFLLVSAVVSMSTPSDEVLQSKEMYRDLRAVHDMAIFRLDELVNDDRAWMVIEIVPDKTCGAITTPGAYFDAATGKFVAPTNAQSATLIAGSWRLVTAVNKAPEIEGGQYFWTKSRKSVFTRDIDPEELYRSFCNAGFLVCRHNPDVNDAGVSNPLSLFFGKPNINNAGAFDPACVLPTGWEHMVKPAYDQFKLDKELFCRGKTQSDGMRLLKFLAGSNSVLSIAALRRLIDAQMLDREAVRTALAQEELRQAVFVYMLITTSQQTDTEMIINEIVRTIGTIGTKEELRPVVVALYTAAYCTDPRGVHQRILASLRERSKKLSQKSEKEEYLDAILRRMGPREDE